MVIVNFGFPLETLSIFIILLLSAICIDFFVHRKDKVITFTNGMISSFFWILLAIIFDGFLYIRHGAEIAKLFFVGYALEEILSVDNLFMIMAILSWFEVPYEYCYRVLHWGIIGVVVFRAIFVIIGTSLFSVGPYMEVVFSLLVGFTALMMLKRNNSCSRITNYTKHPVYRIIKFLCPVWPKISNNAFVLSKKEISAELMKPENKNISFIDFRQSHYYVTPLLLCLAVVEFSDMMFAFDSVPAVISVSREPLISYSAMMFAVVGLRTFYFVLEALKTYLIFLEKTVVFLLFFVAIKLGLNATSHFWNHGYNISTTISLCVVLGVLIIGIIMSMIVLIKNRISNETSE